MAYTKQDREGEKNALGCIEAMSKSFCKQIEEGSGISQSDAQRILQ